MPECPSCGAEVLDIDVKCGGCGAALGATGAHRMLGQVMLGQYELVDVLGQGGMSVVFKGRHKITEQEVALKILPPELAAHSQVKSRFLEEAKALAALDHPNIVHLYNFGQENGYFVLAMQFVDGRTWERMILESKRLDWRASAKICIDVLRALEYAHGRGVVHRDMKPSNVLVREHDGSATVMDFGIAKMTTSTRLTATGQTMGTVRYMSPEQVRGQEVDLRTDLYSLGATLYESLTGDTPFDGNTHFEIMTKHLSEPPKRPSTLGIEIPMAMEDALVRSLAKRADDRFASARDMRKVLETVMRENDLGLVETQKFGGQMVSELRTPKAPAAVATPARSQRMATASELADQLEPTGGHPVRKSPLPWIVLALLILGGGATGAILLVKRSGGHDKPISPFAELSLDPPKQIDGLTITSDGTVPADRVAKAYREELRRLKVRVDEEFGRLKLPAPAIPDKIRDIWALPQSALCMKNAYRDRTEPPRDCEQIPFVLTSAGGDGRPQLYVVAARLEEGMRQGVAFAMCTILDGSDDSARICQLAETRRD